MASSNSPNVRVGVGAFILTSSQQSASNPRFLIGKRIGSHGANTYGLPGGHLEFGETPEQCATREVLEETGLKVSNVRFLTATNDFMPEEGKHYITMFMVCEQTDVNEEARVLEPDKCVAWESVEWEEMVDWAKTALSAREGQVLDRNLFLPLLNLVQQRPGIKPSSC